MVHALNLQNIHIRIPRVVKDVSTDNEKEYQAAEDATTDIITKTGRKLREYDKYKKKSLHNFHFLGTYKMLISIQFPPCYINE